MMVVRPSLFIWKDGHFGVSIMREVLFTPVYVKDNKSPCHLGARGVWGHPPAPGGGLVPKVHPPVNPPSGHQNPIPKPPVSIKKEGFVVNQSQLPVTRFCVSGQIAHDVSL